MKHQGIVVFLASLSVILLFNLPTVDQQRTLADASSCRNPAIKSTNNSTLQRCYRDRFHGYWERKTNRMRSFDERCEEQTLVQEPAMPNPLAKRMGDERHTSETLFDKLKGTCILLFGDSTDRQIVEHWCPRWKASVNLWMPRKKGTGEKLSDARIIQQVRDNGGIQCSPGNKFTFGSYRNYGVAPPPYWKFAHTYETESLPNDLEWGSTTTERIQNDIPKFFDDCGTNGFTNKYIVFQSYLWDLARQWYIEKTDRPPPSMIQDWAANVTTTIESIRQAVPDATLAWRFAGPMQTEGTKEGRDAQAIVDMNHALQALGIAKRVDFVVDYGAVLSSSLATIQHKGYYPVHPPALPRTTYLNHLLNALVAAEMERR